MIKPKSNTLTYKFTCPKCNCNTIQAVITNVIEKSSIDSLSISITKEGKYQLNPNTLNNSYACETKRSKVYYTCGRCERRLTQLDLKKIAFDTNL